MKGAIELSKVSIVLQLVSASPGNRTGNSLHDSRKFLGDNPVLEKSSILFYIINAFK